MMDITLPKAGGLTFSTASHKLEDSETVSARVEESLNATSKLYDLSDIQRQAVTMSIHHIFDKIHERFEHAYNHTIDGETNKKRELITLNFDFRIANSVDIIILNTFMSFGDSTDLQLSIPISVFYRTYQESLYVISNKVLKERFNKPSKANMVCYFKSLNQTSILCVTQRSNANISSRLHFSINELYLTKKVTDEL